MGTAGVAMKLDAADDAVALPPAVPVLRYADFPERWGLTVERFGDGGVRVVVPPVPGWRHVGLGYLISIPVLGCFVAALDVAALRTGEWAPFVANTIIYGGVLVWLIVLVVLRLRRRLAIEVTGRSVSVARVYRRREAGRRTWPRAAVGDIKLNPNDGKLLIRVTGVELVERYLGPNRELNAFVAALLGEAVHCPVPVLAAAEAPAARRSHDASDEQLRVSPFARRTLLTVATVMALVSAVLFFLPPAGPAIAFYLLMIAAVPVGIALGTQKKEYHV